MNTDKIYAEHIANEYSVKKERKVVALKKMDKKVKAPANIFAYTWGIIFALILGVGMCLTLKVIGDNSEISFIIGIVVGIFGIIGCGVNYPIYIAILKKRKNKYANDIITLAKEISAEEE